MYAIFRAKGKQFRAEPEARLRLPSLDAEPGERVSFDEVLLGGEGDAVRIGTPALAGASVEAEVLRHGKDDKIVVYKMKRRKGYRRKQGHRQKFTEIRIVGIELGETATKPTRGEERKKPRAGETTARSAEAQPVAEPVPEPAEAEPGAAPDVEATGAARSLAEEHGLDLASIEGTGAGGRILKGDVEKAIREREAGDAAEEEASGEDGS